MRSEMSIPHTNGQASSKTLSAAACPAGKPPLGEAVRVLSTVESQEAILRLATYRSGETRTERVTSLFLIASGVC